MKIVKIFQYSKNLQIILQQKRNNYLKSQNSLNKMKVYKICIKLHQKKSKKLIILTKIKN